MKTTKSLKAIALSLGLAAMLLPATTMNAQNGGLFGRGDTHESASNDMMGRSGGAAIADGGGITNYGIGEEDAPMGSGIAILMGLGLGYVALKKKEDKQ